MTKNHKVHIKKRHGLHHKQSKRYQHVYLPYLPAVLLIIASLLVGGFRFSFSKTGVLAYATEMSTGNLLSETNVHRVNSGASSLALSSKLNQAAQAKARDMVARDYWSHNTPDGQEPWVFMDQAGYSYQKAGENLAYGFSTSSQTVTGWMNSPSHKANMLDASFTEVGFGFVNGENYQGSGNQTVVVAMYAKPQVASATSPAPAPAPPQANSATPSPAPAPKPASPTQSHNDNAKNQQSNQQTADEEEVPELATLQTTEDEDESEKIPLATTEKPISRGQAIRNTGLPWATFALGIIGGTAATALLVNHGLRFHKLLKQSRRFVLHHPVLDVTMISIIIFVVTLSQNIGIIL